MALLYNVAAPTSAYHTVGVVDQHGQTIIPCNYANIQSLGHGLFFLEFLDKVHPLRRTYSGELFDQDGKTVSVNIPADAALTKVYLPAENKIAGGYLHKVPDGTVFQFKTAKGFGLCRKDGTIIMPAMTCWIEEANAGYFQVCSGTPLDRTALLFTIDSATGKRVAAPQDSQTLGIQSGAIFPFRCMKNGDSVLGYMRRDGTVAVEPQYSVAKEFSPEGLAVVGKEWRAPVEYINSTGKVVSPQKYDDARNFINGRAVFGVGPEETRKFGLIDATFKVTVPPIYRELSHLFDHTYLAIDDSSKPFKAISDNGKLLFTFPETVFDVGGYDNGLIYCQRKALEMKDRTAIYFDRHGDEVIPQDDRRLKEIRFGMIATCKKDGPKPEWQVTDSSGHILIPYHSSPLSIVSNNRIIKSKLNDHFHKAIWDDPNPTMPQGASRVQIFGSLLTDYNLIGMSQDDVEKLIGSPLNSKLGEKTYDLEGSSCIPFFRRLELKYDQGVLVAWREIFRGEQTKDGPWIDFNAIIAPANSFGKRRTKSLFFNLVAKENRETERNSN